MNAQVVSARGAGVWRKFVLASALVLIAAPVQAVCNLTPVQAVGAGSKPSAVATSPDSQNAYLTTFDDDSVTVFRRAGAGCGLGLVHSVSDGSPLFPGAVDGLDGASAVAVSPDGNNVYVAGELDHAIAVFHRDAADEGRLSFLEAKVDGQNLPLNVLRRPRSVAVSQDGLNVYAAGSGSSNSLVVFRRLSDGRLEPLESFLNASAGVDGLKGPSGVAVTGDGFNVYVSGATDGTVVVFRRDPSNEGRLTFMGFLTKGVTPGLAGASGVGVSPDDAHVYVTGRDANALVVFRRNVDDPPTHPSFGWLAYVQTTTAAASTPLHAPSAVTVAPSDGHHVYVTSRQDHALLAFARDPATGRVELVETRKDGAPGVSSLEAPVNVAVSTDECLYVASEEDNAVMVFDRFEPDATACDDFNPCTLADHCSAGACAGACNVGATCPIPCFNITGTCQLLSGSVCGCAE